MQKFYQLLIFILIFVSISFAEIQKLEINSKAPAFTVVSGACKTLTLDSLTGKVAVIFYEKKEVIEKNRALKNAMNEFYDSQPVNVKKYIVRLPIIDCSGAFWPFKGIWKKKLIENSKKEGFTIFGDWNGEMCENYNLENKNSTVIILNKNGIIKYIASDKECNFKIIKSILETI